MNRDSSSGSARVHELLAKLKEPDMDYRYMALNDLLAELQKNDSLLEESINAKIVDSVLKTLADSSGEVQSMGVKCLGPLVRRSKDSQIQIVLERLTKTSSQTETRSMSSTALRTVIIEVPAHSASATTVAKRLVPRLIEQIQDNKVSSDILLDALDTLVELLNRFGLTIQTFSDAEQATLVKACLPLLSHSRPAVRKRVIIALGSLSVRLTDSLFANLISNLLQMFTTTRNDDLLATLFDLCGQISRADSALAGESRFSPYLQSILPPVLDAIEHEDDSLKESCLQAIESFLLMGTESAKRFENSIVDTTLKYLSYDPNYHADDSDDEIMEEEGDSTGDVSDFSDNDEYEV